MIWRSRSLWTGVLLGLTGFPVLAQVPPPPPLYDTPASEPTPQATPRYPACKPPLQGEYLLLVVTETPDSQESLRQTLPANASSTVCSYLENVVTRVGGFRSVDNANAWARYLKESMGLTAIVARPVVAAKPSTSTPPANSGGTPAKPQTGSTLPRTNPGAYNPQPLGAGYAVLVDFFNKPELVPQVQQALGKQIGLAVYRQRPFLLAAYTADQTTANTILKTLNDRGFWAMVVDSKRVTLLKQKVANQ